MSETESTPDQLQQQEKSLNDPWMVAVWPGMGNVAVSAGYYLMAKLEMRQLAEFSPQELFELEHVEVKSGLIRSGRLPRSRLFLWEDPRQNHDVVVFIGEAQPPAGKRIFCRKLVEFASELGVERIFTFAAMATDRRPEEEARVFGAATDKETLADLQRLELTILEDGQISGLNGVLLGVAAESGLPGACLLGEMPQLFSQLPNPKASLAVLEAFTAMDRIDLDFTELAGQAKQMEHQLASLLDQIEKAIDQQGPGNALEGDEAIGSPDLSDTPLQAPSAKEEDLSEADRDRIEELFTEAAKDRSKAYELKAELDRLRVFERYEDRFLDLFQNPG